MPTALKVTPYDIASRFLGLSEVEGHAANPQIVAMLQLEAPQITDDETPWCSAFVNYVAWLLSLPRSKSLAARSWLRIGDLVGAYSAEVGFDVVVLQRGDGKQPGPEVIAAPGHVGFFAGFGPGRVKLLGGNQGNAVSIASFPADRVLGVRRLRVA